MLCCRVGFIYVSQGLRDRRGRRDTPASSRGRSRRAESRRRASGRRSTSPRTRPSWRRLAGTSRRIWDICTRRRWQAVQHRAVASSPEKAEQQEQQQEACSRPTCMAAAACTAVALLTELEARDPTRSTGRYAPIHRSAARSCHMKSLFSPRRITGVTPAV